MLRFQLKRNALKVPQKPFRAVLRHRYSNQEPLFYAGLRAFGTKFAHRLPTGIFCPQIVVASVLRSYYITFCRILQVF